MRWFPDKLMVLFNEVVIDLYSIITLCCFFRNVIILPWVCLPSDKPGFQVKKVLHLFFTVMFAIRFSFGWFRNCWNKGLYSSFIAGLKIFQTFGFCLIMSGIFIFLPMWIGIKLKRSHLNIHIIPVCTWSPICSSNIIADFPFSRYTFDEDGKQPFFSGWHSQQ